MPINLLETIPDMDMSNVYKVVKAIEKSGDEQSSDLVKDIWIKLKKATELTQNQTYAFNILNRVVEKKGRLDAQGSLRNQIFKAANALGIKLPSSMFAGEKVALSGGGKNTVKAVTRQLNNLPGILKARNVGYSENNRELVTYHALTLDPKLAGANNVPYEVHKLVASRLYNHLVNHHWAWREFSVEMDSRKYRYKPEEKIDGKSVLVVCEFEFTLGMTSSIDRVAARYQLAKGIVAKVDANKLPKPSPWTVPIPWGEAKSQIAENLAYFDRVGCKIRKLRPVADPYVQMFYKGNTFTLALGRMMPNAMGNLWVEPDVAKTVAAKLPRMIGSLTTLKNVAVQGNGMVIRSILDRTMKKLFNNRWERNLAYGIAESWLELGGVPVVDTISEVNELVD